MTLGWPASFLLGGSLPLGISLAWLTLGPPALAFVVMLCLWYTRGRDPRVRSIAAQYEPPDSLSPAELGALMENSLELPDLGATLVDLAVRGYLRIEAKGKKDYSFQLRKPPGEWGTLTPHEQALLEGVFAGVAPLMQRELRERGGGRTLTGPEQRLLGQVSQLPATLREGLTVDLSELEARLHWCVSIIHQRLSSALIARQYYRTEPDGASAKYQIAGASMIVVSLFLGGVLTHFYGIKMMLVFVSGLLSGIVILVFARWMPVRTVRGTQALERALGFKEFLARAEADRFQRVVKTPQLFEKNLPYAMALGVEKKWARTFEGIYREPPDWYRGPGRDAFGSSRLTDDLREMSQRIDSGLRAREQRKTGSGLSDRGRAGGGFGGGGGGF